MNKFYSLFFIFFSIFFTACNPTTSLEHFSNNPVDAYSVQYTKKRDILFNKELKAMLFATYLNKISTKYNTNEVYSFVIGVQYVNNEDDELIKSVTLNGKKPLSFINLKKESKLLKNISLKNNWAKYYLVDFTKDKDDESNKLNLDFSHSTWGKALISFPK
ncbi:hypothetical protein [Halarcobacter anaerophilus]|uniref:Lipoprotein n=1 Tax=Halarcobacter anaerophilus TaxID=877500 RepID=A0A4Q0Y4I3_9BACT|nr:hypothetical protein [Halarcobacter anaerophilus]QDF29026.1 hypothetical protein AANAER_1549 [Halarcobacter anaerophilus]RXJ63659.1 hypothetical protein CRV06_05570 [Halarcobacter anaerophilus]